MDGRRKSSSGQAGGWREPDTEVDCASVAAGLPGYGWLYGPDSTTRLAVGWRPAS